MMDKEELARYKRETNGVCRISGERKDLVVMYDCGGKDIETSTKIALCGKHHEEFTTSSKHQKALLEMLKLSSTDDIIRFSDIIRGNLLSEIEEKEEQQRRMAVFVYALNVLLFILAFPPNVQNHAHYCVQSATKVIANEFVYMKMRVNWK
jgi:hypothetical protein